MTSLNPLRAYRDAETLQALAKSFAVIEFKPDGTILSANDVFLRTMGYSANEIVGRHHRIFVGREEAQSGAYSEFWQKLRAGTFDSGEFARRTKSGDEIWLRGSYTPVRGRNGKIYKIVKLALDITKEKLQAVNDEGLLAAINRSQAVIEFALDGTILAANENFLQTLGYGRDEIIGRKHSMFVEPGYSASAEYQDFWTRLRRGEFFSTEFHRIRKGGRAIWLQASYNPVFDATGKATKVVKFATDLSERMEHVGIVAGALERVARGDLTAHIETTLMPSLDRLRVDFNVSAAALREALLAVGESASAINGSAATVSQAADELSQRTERQAASLEETAAALDEITATVRNTAENAAQVNEVVRAATGDTRASEAVVQEAVQAMNKIDASSAQIGRIIGVIDEIAFQTNLLALNAGVEAARAGDAGRGFAVVATEVRALAQRSADAAKEIKTLINASGTEVAAGVRAVGLAREALERIAQHVVSINASVGAIAASTSEQSQGLGQINSAVNQMDQMTQQSAAMVEEAAATGQSLTHEVEGIMALLGKFSTGASPVVAASSTPARRATVGRRAMALA
jgi:methyl-accepting chemotaxis protein